MEAHTDPGGRRASHGEPISLSSSPMRWWKNSFGSSIRINGLNSCVPETTGIESDTLRDKDESEEEEPNVNWEVPEDEEDLIFKQTAASREKRRQKNEKVTKARPKYGLPCVFI